MGRARTAFIVVAIEAALLAFVAWPAACTEILRVGTEKNSCRFCHGKERMKYNGSVHDKYDVACADCHGGDGTATEKSAAMSPTKGFKGKLTAAQIPAMCASCHGDYLAMRQYGIGAQQLTEYKTSVHGIQLLQHGDTNMAQCTSCHGTHDISRVSSPTASVYPRNVAATCGKCHADKTLMAKYKLKSSQFNDYMNSVHGKSLVKEGNLSSPSCASCHGSHGAAPPGTSEVVNVCGKCHLDERDNFAQSAHFKNNVKCIDCHLNHKILRVDGKIYRSREKGGCLSCHKDKKSAAGQYIERVAELREISLMKLAATEKDIEKAKRSGMNFRGQKAELKAAYAGLKKFGPMQHLLSTKTDDDILSREVNSRTDQIQYDIEAYYDARLNRRIIIGIVASIILVLMAAIAVTIKLRKSKKAKHTTPGS